MSQFSKVDAINISLLLFELFHIPEMLRMKTLAHFVYLQPFPEIALPVCQIGLPVVR